MKTKIYCIGDSHVSVFLGRDSLAQIYPIRNKSLFSKFEVIRIGPITAFNIGKVNSSTQAKVKIDILIKNEIPENSVFIFSAGEIDIRVHLLKQAKLKNKSILEISSEIIENYIKFLRKYAVEGNKIVVLSPPPASYLLDDDPEYPKNGTEQERNIATKIFCVQLKFQTQKNGFGFIDIFSNYIDINNNTKRQFLWDGVHPSSFVIKDIIRQLNKILSEKLTIPLSWIVREVFSKFKNITFSNDLFKRYR